MCELYVDDAELYYFNKTEDDCSMLHNVWNKLAA